MTYEPALARKSGESILAFWPKTDMNNKSVNKDVYLKMVSPKNVANYLKINLAPKTFMVFLLEKLHHRFWLTS